MTEVSGLLAPLVTPFTDDGQSLSEVRMARLVRHLVSRDIAGFVVNSDTGEFTSMNLSERKSVVEYTIRDAQGKPVLVNVSALNTNAALDLAQHADRHGARGIVVMPPYYGVFADEEIARFFDSLAAYCEQAMIVVDPLSRLDADLLAHVGGLRSTHIAESVYGPGHPTRTDTFRSGGAVCTPVGQIRQHGEIAALTNLMNSFGSIAVCKAALEFEEIEVGHPRAPRVPLSDERRQVLRAALAPSS